MDRTIFEGSQYLDSKSVQNSEHNDFLCKGASQDSLSNLLDKYEKNRRPIQVDFRTLTQWVSYGERASHMIHLYPAKLLPHIPNFFLSNQLLSNKGDTVLDPFSGSGTAVLEALLAGRRAIAADSNPLARLITEVKTTPLDRQKLLLSFARLRTRMTNTRRKGKAPDVVNIDHWFHLHVKNQLTHIKECIDVVRDEPIKKFFMVAFSNIVKRVSLADPRLAVPVKLRKDKYDKNSVHYKQTSKILDKLENVNVYNEFSKMVHANTERIHAYTSIVGLNVATPEIYEDSRELSAHSFQVKNEQVQLVITSPPYVGAQKYIRSSCLNMGWLEHCKSNELRKFERLNIGREHYSKKEYLVFQQTGYAKIDKLLKSIYLINPLRAHIASNYLLEMKDAFVEIHRVLKKGGYFVLVTSNNTVCGQEFKTHEYLRIIAEEIGLRVRLRLVDDIHSRGLMTKRNKTAGIISCEWVYLFEKGI